MWKKRSSGVDPVIGTPVPWPSAGPDRRGLSDYKMVAAKGLPPSTAGRQQTSTWCPGSRSEAALARRLQEDCRAKEPRHGVVGGEGRSDSGRQAGCCTVMLDRRPQVAGGRRAEARGSCSKVSHASALAAEVLQRGRHGGDGASLPMPRPAHAPGRRGLKQAGERTRVSLRRQTRLDGRLLLRCAEPTARERRYPRRGRRRRGAGSCQLAATRLLGDGTRNGRRRKGEDKYAKVLDNRCVGYPQRPEPVGDRIEEAVAPGEGRDLAPAKRWLTTWYDAAGPTPLPRRPGREGRVMRPGLPGTAAGG